MWKYLEVCAMCSYPPLDQHEFQFYQGLRLKSKTMLDGDDTENVGLMKWEHLTLTDFSPFIQSSSLTQSEISNSIELNRSLSDMI